MGGDLLHIRVRHDAGTQMAVISGLLKIHVPQVSTMLCDRTNRDVNITVVRTMAKMATRLRVLFALKLRFVNVRIIDFVFSWYHRLTLQSGHLRYEWYDLPALQFPGYG